MTSWSVDWRARRIRDPLKRLRYLRWAAEHSPSPAELRSFRWLRRAGPLVAAAALLSLAAGRIVSSNSHLRRRLPPEVRQATAVAIPETLSSVWLVERSDEFDLYSNGLRVDNAFLVSNSPRRYRVISLRPAGSSAVAERTDPAGIVYHTTESHLAPFAQDHNRALRRAGEGLLDYVRRRRSYHFVIDRFGRVFRVVQETDAADHAGRSIWADDRWVYIGLNQSYLAVAFEAQTPSVNPAQVHTARVLTEMLRARYEIPASNCVTHAQVSVNLQNRRIGYHTDWAADFPFRELGLPDNYGQTLASVSLFGFGYDDHLVEAAGGRLWPGLLRAEEQLERDAAAAAMPTARLRTVLYQRFREALAATENP